MKSACPNSLKICLRSVRLLINISFQNIARKIYFFFFLFLFSVDVDIIFFLLKTLIRLGMVDRRVMKSALLMNILYIVIFWEEQWTVIFLRYWWKENIEIIFTFLFFENLIIVLNSTHHIFFVGTKSKSNRQRQQTQGTCL